METKLVRLSPYCISEIEDYGKEVDAGTFDVATRHVLSELKKYRELEEARK